MQKHSWQLTPLLLAMATVLAMQGAHADDDAAQAVSEMAPKTADTPIVMLDAEEIVVQRGARVHSAFGGAKPSDIVVTADQLRSRAATLGDALSGELGVRSSHFGGGASAPIIRGQEGKRLKILQNGSDVIDMASLSPDHAVMVDPLLAGQVEIVRGPSTLLYSSGNVAGQINVVDDVILDHVPDAPTGDATLRFNTGSDEKVASVGVSLPIGSQVAISAKGITRRANDYQTPEYQRYQFDNEKALKAHLAAPENLASLESEYQHWLANHHQQPYFRYRPANERHFIRSESQYLEQKQRYTDAIVTPKHLDYLPDSWANADALSLGVSWVGTSGYVGASVSHREDEYGLPAHNPMYEGCGAYVISPASERAKPYLMSYPQLMGEDDVNYLNPRADCLQAEVFDSSGGHTHSTKEHTHGAPHITLTNRRYDLKGELYDPIAGIDTVKLSVGHSDYQHQEKEGDTISSDFKNKATTARLEMIQTPTEKLSGTWGVRYLISKNSALSPSIAKGRQTLGENRTDNIALFGLQQYELSDALSLQASARAERQRIKMDYDLDKITSVMQPVPNRYNSSYIDAANQKRAEHLAQALNDTKANQDTAYSYALGATWKFAPKHRLTVTASHQERLPNAQELYTHGAHLATNSFEVGNKNLTKEKSNNLEIALDYQGEKLDYQLAAYHYDFDNYIYLQTLNASLGNSAVIAPYSLRINRYSQAKAKFSGLEGSIGYQFTPVYHASLFGDVITGKLTDLPDEVVAYDNWTDERTYAAQVDRYTPRLPPARLGARIKADVADGVSGELEYYHVFDQNKLSKFEQPTQGHHMLNLGVNYRKDWGAGEYELFLRGNNLLDEPVYAHETFLPYIPQMGRNFSLGATYRF
ncbi:TonB-dependent receptor [Moraxella sp. FZLJ2107]|uniref:TonB-dependent receptor n=1 Tax=unclassified Moraxella TaxID=2685852 RepID=UPI0020C9310A|nr:MULTISPECIES: TonB-dependent receptor [unclassified Moraxella]UTO04356.1 TonB-dependent receptor [Moraxella sp. FZLJ2107]UTO23189.1 TonB-dependent receptor [Moraxella sp. FZLJ2109]